jgi:5,10-methylenetetrahydromethanopterin reductase
MQVSIRVPPFAPVAEVAAFTQECEAAGFDGVGYIDSQMITRDVFVVLAHVAAATSRVRLFPAVTNPLTRHVSVLASSALTLADLAPGRVELWLGRGFSSANLVGLPYATVAQLRRAVQQYRRLLAREWDVFSGAHSYMQPADGRHVPLILAASGPKTLRLAGEVADGVLISVGNGDEEIAAARELVVEGARAAGRDPGDVRLIACLTAVIRPEREAARAWASPLCTHRLNATGWLRRHGIDAGDLRPPAELLELYPDYFHAEDWERAVELSAFIPRPLRAQLCDAIGLFGTPDDGVRRLQELRDAGFDEVFLQTVGTLNFPEEEVRAFATTIGPALAAAAV